MRISYIPAIAVLTVLVNCLDGAPVPKDVKPPKLYFPIVVGTKWVMKTGDREQAHVVARVDNRDGVYTVVVGLDSGRGVAFADVTEQVSEKGVSRLLKSTIIDVPDGLLPLIRTPFREGESWETTIATDGVSGKWKKTVVGEENVTVPAGKFSAVRVDWERYGDKKLVASGSDWYALGVGLVKQKFATDIGGGAVHTSQSEMQSFTPPPAAKRDK